MELSQHQEIQADIFDEIKDTHLEDIDRELPLLETFILEVLRKHPPIPCGTRSCTKDCTITMTQGDVLKFVKGDLIHLPFHLMQNDRKLFRHPEMFNPRRFDSELTKASLYPFGLGPRSCLGKNFALFQAKLLVVSILRVYLVKPCDNPPKSSEWQLELIPHTV